MKNPLLKKYIAILVSLAGCLLIISITSIWAYSITAQSAANIDFAEPNGLENNSQNNSSENSDNTQIDNLFPQPTPRPSNLPPERTNVLILGLDDGDFLPDVIMLLTYDGDHNMIDIISVPRDAYVALTQDKIDELREFSRNAPRNGIMKLNELHSFAGRNHGPRFVREYLEEVFDIEIDYQVILDMRAFRYIVDAVGGIVLDIRPEGMYNNHPEATIAINIPGGRQRLDGRMAEQFVRFRDSTGDLGRIERQQYFMHEFFNQILTIEHIMNNPIAFVSTLFDYIQTDFSFFDVPVYSQAINALSMESIEFHVLEGEARNGRHGDGRLTSFFFIDEARAKDLIDEIYADNIINAIGIDEDEQY